MVLLIIIPIKWLFHWEYTLFSDKPIYRSSTTPGFVRATVGKENTFESEKCGDGSESIPKGAEMFIAILM